VIGGLGGAYVLIAVARGAAGFGGGAPLGNVLIVTALIAGPGIGLLYGTSRLSRAEIDAEFYLDVAGWCLLGLAAMSLILVLFQLQPAGRVSSPYTSPPILVALSTVAGFGIGLHDAKAKTRTRELEHRNRQIRETRTELEETVDQLRTSNERLEQFAYAASHDLQEPLRMVSSYLQLIERRYVEDLDEEGREFLEFAIDGADRMRAMIDGLLAYSRVESEGEPLEPVELGPVVEEVREDLQVKIEETDAEIAVEDLSRVDGDADQLRQVFQNLFENAITYSGEAPPRIHVDAERTDGTWTISVEDEGIGIPPEDQEQVFEVFERAHSRSEHDSSGIGLAVCQRIVERHGGEIRIDSEPGEGTTVSFTLPAAGGAND
jgi:signal transduction histidine kinase